MKPSDISAFLEKYAAGIHSSAEHQEFIEWLKSAPIHEVEQYTDQYYAISQKDSSGDIDPQMVIQIEKALDQYELGRTVLNPVYSGKVFPWRTIYRIAAAVFLLVLSGYLVKTLVGVNKSEKDSALPVLQAKSVELLPGSNKAILTLGDGKTITLDDAGNGQVAQQGNTQVYKTASGEVVYKSKGNKPSDILYNTLSTPRGGQYKLTLPDGSTVWLNSASSIRYPNTFAGNERKVEVSGEVYFEIAKDASKPFFVAVNDMTVKVLGTHFNINAYNEETSVKTTLLEGSINLSHSGGSTTILKPGQQAQLASEGDFRLVDDVDVEDVVAWKNGYFSFNKADLPTVMRQISRWYDVTISYEGQIPAREFVGKISRDNNASEVLKILQESKVHFRIEGKKIIVTP